MSTNDEKPGIPSRTRCPACGGKPTEQSERDVRLSDLGYRHADQVFTCEDCGEKWTCGVPIGYGTELADDLMCGSCGEFMLVHRVLTNEGQSVQLHLKCGNHDPFDCPECEMEDEVGFDTAGAYCRYCGYRPDRDELEGCYNFDQTKRICDGSARTLVGYPQITGELNPENPYGFDPERIEFGDD